MFLRLVFAILFLVFARANFSFHFRYKSIGWGSDSIKDKFQLASNTQRQIIDNLLRILEENSTEEEINEGRLKYFTIKIKIWDYFNITKQKFVSLPSEERSSMLKRYCFSK